MIHDGQFGSSSAVIISLHFSNGALKRVTICYVAFADFNLCFGRKFLKACSQLLICIITLFRNQNRHWTANARSRCIKGNSSNKWPCPTCAYITFPMGIYQFGKILLHNFGKDLVKASTCISHWHHLMMISPLGVCI